MNANKMKISQIRTVIQSAEHTRNWLTGGTPEEFRRQQIGPALRKKIAELQALDIAPRFADDIEWRAQEIERCETVVARWEAAQNAAPADTRTCIEGGKRHVLLGSPCCQLCGATVFRSAHQ